MTLQEKCDTEIQNPCVTCDKDCDIYVWRTCCKRCKFERDGDTDCGTCLLLGEW